LRGDLTGAAERAAAVIAVADEHGFPDWLGMGGCLQGWVLAGQGKFKEGIAQMRFFLDAFRAQGTELGAAGMLARIAAAHGQAGQPEEGLALITEGCDVMSRTGERPPESHLYRIRGELLLALSDDNRTDAEACLRQAVEVARRQSAKSLELLAAMSLSRLWRQQGKKEEARKMLAEIYGWFTEGFDTQDLEEAKALLEELGGAEPPV